MTTRDGELTSCLKTQGGVEIYFSPFFLCLFLSSLALAVRSYRSHLVARDVDLRGWLVTQPLDGVVAVGFPRPYGKCQGICSQSPVSSHYRSAYPRDATDVRLKANECRLGTRTGGAGTVTLA